MSRGPRDEAVIRTPDRRLRVFVSSTLGELAEERRAVARAVSALRLTPVMFEEGARPYPPAQVYRAYLAQADVFIGLYWQRYGQPVPGGQVSGLEDEFGLSDGLPRLLYVKGPAPDREPRLAELLARIQEESSASYRHFRTPAELGRVVRDDLAVLLSERFTAAAGPAAAPSPAGARGAGRLPVSTTSLLGRERAIDEVAEQADRPLRGPGRSEWLERLQAEAGNLAAAVRWYLAHDPGPLPHLFRVLWLFWTQEDLEREAWSWVKQLLPPAGTLDQQASAELAWTATVLAVDIGEDTAALAACQRLAPLLASIQDPFLHAICQLAMAWSLPITGDFDEALREVTAALEALRGQDEPVFTAMAADTAGSLDTALGRHGEALRHLREVRDLAERSDGDWLAAGSRVQLGTLAVLRGSLDEARALLEEALDLSLAAARSTPFVTLCLAGYAQLAFAEDDPERAALLEGAAEGLRRRVGLPAWPHLRRVEAEMVAQVRHRLGAARFDQAFSAGSRLAQRDAIAIVRDQRRTSTQTS